MKDIPDFLKPENCKKNPYADEMAELTERYEEHFGKELSTEPAPYGIKDWVKILRKCLEEDIEVEQLLKGEIETSDLEEHEFIYIIQ